MSTDLTVVDRGALEQPADTPPILITSEQLALIKATIAAEATDAELELFCYDCRRRGVHPLDKLIHFTKRQGKYTPVTSIDFFRSRAERTHEHMGTTDALYHGQPGDEDFAATVTVYRLVQGERCAFPGTARFAEFCPGPPNDFMWRKMPFNQIAKCAEAQALRRGFPQELRGLHTVDEMEHVPLDPKAPPRTVRRASERSTLTAAPPTTPPPVEAASAGKLLAIGRVKTVTVFGKDKNNYGVVLAGDDPTEYTTKDVEVKRALERFKGTADQIQIVFEDRVWQGKVYHNIIKWSVIEAPAAAPATPAGAPLTAGDIPF